MSIRSTPPAIQHRPRRDWAAAGATAAVGLATTAGLGGEVYDRGPGSFDVRVHDWAVAHRAPGLLVGFEWVTRIGEPAVVVAIAVATAIWLWRVGARHAAIVLASAPVTAVIVFNVVKQLVHRARPVGGLLLRAATYSFPSGHSVVSAAAFGSLAWVLARESILSWRVATLLAVLCPLLIGVSRIYLGVHWATDVLGGWCLGFAIAALWIGGYERVRGRASTAR